MALGHLVLGRNDLLAVLIGLLGIELAVYFVGYGIAVHGKRCVDRKILGGHGFGDLPAGEGMALGHLVFGRNDRFAIGIILIRAELSVDRVGQGKYAYSLPVHGRIDRVFRDGPGSRIPPHKDEYALIGGRLFRSCARIDGCIAFGHRTGIELGAVVIHESCGMVNGDSLERCGNGVIVAWHPELDRRRGLAAGDDPAVEQTFPLAELLPFRRGIRRCRNGRPRRINARSRAESNYHGITRIIGCGKFNAVIGHNERCLRSARVAGYEFKPIRAEPPLERLAARGIVCLYRNAPALGIYAAAFTAVDGNGAVRKEQLRSAVVVHYVVGGVVAEEPRDVIIRHGIVSGPFCKLAGCFHLHADARVFVQFAGNADSLARITVIN